MRSIRPIQVALISLAALSVAPGCHRKEAAELAALKSAMEATQLNLAKFDDLDFNVFSGQKWDQLGKSHARDVVVHWPDGHVTTGLDQHEHDLQAMFAWAPDTRITDHPVKVANGEWTAVTGVMQGTFSKPMPMADGKNIAPTGKQFKLTMSTFGHWKNGVMDEEYLFWDNQSLMEQLGLNTKPQGSYQDPDDTFPDDK
jgi:predicted ester cyclase